MKIENQQMQIISLTDAPNGAETVLLKLAIAVRGKLIFLKKNKTHRLSIPSDIRVQYLSERHIVFGLIKLLVNLRKFSNWHILMSTHPYLNALLGIAKRLGILKSQLIVRECTSVFTRFYGLKKLAYLVLYRLGYTGVDLMICQTDVMKSQLLIHNPFLRDKRIIVQPNPVDSENLLSLALTPLNEDEVQEEYICSAGRLIPEKGFDILIKAFKIIHQRNPKLKLYILGEGREEQSLKELIKSNNLQDTVLLKGHISNPAPYFKNAKLCVVSSVIEGFPNVLLEMMALNPYVVSTLCAGGISSIPNIIKAKANSVEDLVEAIRQCLIITEQTEKNQNNPHGDYLNARNPKHFAHSILDSLTQ